MLFPRWKGARFLSRRRGKSSFVFSPGCKLRDSTFGGNPERRRELKSSPLHLSCARARHYTCCVVITHRPGTICPSRFRYLIGRYGGLRVKMRQQRRKLRTSRQALHVFINHVQFHRTRRLVSRVISHTHAVLLQDCIVSRYCASLVGFSARCIHRTE